MKLILTDTASSEVSVTSVQLNLIDGRTPQVAMHALITQSFSMSPWLVVDAGGALDKALQALHVQHLWAFESYTKAGEAYWTLTCSIARASNPVMI